MCFWCTHKYFCFKYNKYICLKNNCIFDANQSINAFFHIWIKKNVCKCVLKLILLHLVQYENWRIGEKCENLLFYSLNYLLTRLMSTVFNCCFNKDKQKTMLMFKMTVKKWYDDNNDNVSTMSSQKECCRTGKVVMLWTARGSAEDITLALNVMGVHSSKNSFVYSNMRHHHDFLCQHICSVTAVGRDHFLQFVTL